MIMQVLARLFDRYCAAHVRTIGRPMPLFGEDGETLGYIDDLGICATRLHLEGWADCDQIMLSHGGQRITRVPHLQRLDVSKAFSDLSTQTPGFTADMLWSEGPLTLTLLRGDDRFVFAVPLPDSRAMRIARLRLVSPFLRDLWRATPAVLRWIVTKDPAQRAHLKRAFRLDAPPPLHQMQTLLFLEDSMATLPLDRQIAERARLQGAAFALRGITIILPIYNALDLLPEVLARVVQNTDLPWRLILIEDASTDAAVRPMVRAWVKSQYSSRRDQAILPDQITLIENSENQGFIRAVNSGLAQAIKHGDHVVLLNSDAFVPKGWASRLLRPFLEHDRVATVTPMSNDAEIFTVPAMCKPSGLSAGQGDAIDVIARKIHPDAGLADAPTGVGFCMAMSIDYLRRIPQFDTSFGRGYGEEVDWCQKVSAVGGRNLGLANLFVEHRGGTSFGSIDKQRLIAKNGAEISRRYPHFDRDVQQFMAADPLATPRLALAIAWAAGEAKGPIPLYLAHNMGGGAEDYLTQRISGDLPGAALVLRVGTGLHWQLELHSAQGITQGGTNDFALIKRLLDPVKSLRIIYSCGVGAPNPIDLPRAMLDLMRGSYDSAELLVHDYLPISPSYTLLNARGRFTGLPDPAQPDTAHMARRADGGRWTLHDWQGAWRAFIARCDDITVFSQSSHDLFLAAFPLAQGKLHVAPHRPLVELPRFSRPAPYSSHAKTPVIGVLGNIGHHKGAQVLQDLSQRLSDTGAGKLVVLGRMDPTYHLARPATVHGGYLRPDIPALIAQYGITDWLIPSIWPESFSYTTHEAIATGLPVWSFDLGAQADAIRKSGRGGTVPIPGGVPDIDTLLVALLTPNTQKESNAA